MDDTIAANATPAGEGGIGIIRISGNEAFDILGKIFVAGKNKENAKKPVKPRELTYGFIIDNSNDSIVDEVLSVFMPAPGTYTREDVVEINCHGGSIPLMRTLQLILREGARLAEPGEFTKRAFLNGRLDLSQAEAVLDVINSKTEDALNVAISQLQGKFSKEVTSLRKAITDILVDVDVNIDYPDEDIEEITYDKLKDGLSKVKSNIRNLLDSADSGKILRDGLSIAIIGKPNAGKSSLLNKLLRESRAIVTDIPGTTRDTIEEFANIKGIPVKLTDTAGIRDATDEIEKIGIERSKESLENADITILMVDMSQEIDSGLRYLLESVEPKKTILVFNKDDMPPSLSEDEIKEIAANRGTPFAIIIRTSVLNSDIAIIEDAIYQLSGYAPPEHDPSEYESLDKKHDGAYVSNTPSSNNDNPNNDNEVNKVDRISLKSGSIVTNVRHKAMLEMAEKSIDDAIIALSEGAPLEFVEIDVRNAYEELGFITGDSVQDDIIDQIFSRFCLGK